MYKGTQIYKHTHTHKHTYIHKNRKNTQIDAHIGKHIPTGTNKHTCSHAHSLINTQHIHKDIKRKTR